MIKLIDFFLLNVYSFVHFKDEKVTADVLVDNLHYDTITTTLFKYDKQAGSPLCHIKEFRKQLERTNPNEKRRIETTFTKGCAKSITAHYPLLTNDVPVSDLDCKHIIVTYFETKGYAFAIMLLFKNGINKKTNVISGYTAKVIPLTEETSADVEELEILQKTMDAFIVHYADKIDNGYIITLKDCFATTKSYDNVAQQMKADGYAI